MRADLSLCVRAVCVSHVVLPPTRGSQIERLKRREFLSEPEVKALCAKAKEVCGTRRADTLNPPFRPGHTQPRRSSRR